MDDWTLERRERQGATIHRWTGASLAAAEGLAQVAVTGHTAGGRIRSEGVFFDRIGYGHVASIAPQASLGNSWVGSSGLCYGKTDGSSRRKCFTKCSIGSSAGAAPAWGGVLPVVAAGVDASDHASLVMRAAHVLRRWRRRHYYGLRSAQFWGRRGWSD